MVKKMEILNKHIGVTLLLQVLVCCCLGAAQVKGLLTYDHYSKTCPKVEYIIRAGMESISLADPSTPAAMLRLMFHDCQVQGCDASILLDGGGTAQSSEMASAKNFGVRKRGAVDLLKSAAEAVCPKQVSCSDILVLAAREAVSLSGGPRIDVPLGRRDSSTPPSSKAADASLPSADVGVDAVLQLFAGKGMTAEETVAIIGAHTLGTTHCVNLENRLYNLSGRGKMNPLFEDMLKLKCPKGSLLPSNEISFVENDLTPAVFDNRYFVDALNGRGLLRADAEMAVDSRTAAHVRRFAGDGEAFFKAFASAFVKLSSSHVLTGSKGVVRRTCNSLD